MFLEDNHPVYRVTFLLYKDKASRDEGKNHVDSLSVQFNDSAAMDVIIKSAYSSLKKIDDFSGAVDE